jgi:hypothetical protein
MPQKQSEFKVPIGLRVSQAQAKKLEELSARTGRQRNALLRYLIDCAQFSGTPDINITAEAGGETDDMVLAAKGGPSDAA